MHVLHWPSGFAIILLATGSSLWADTALTLTPMQAVGRALAANRDLAAARFAIAQAEAKLIQAGLHPNPEFDLSQQNAKGGEYNFSTGFKQRFPITSRLARAKDVARVDIALAAAEISNKERELAGQVLERARTLQLIAEKYRTILDIQATVEKLVTLSEKRAKTGEVPETDLNLAKIELQKARLGQATLAAEEDSTAAELNQLLGRDPTAKIAVSGGINSSFDHEQVARDSRLAIQRRPDRQIALLQVDRAAAEKALAKSEKWEDWSVGLGFSRDVGKFDAPIGTKADNFIGVSISIPLPLFNKNQGKISEAEASRQRAEAEVRAIDLRIAAEIEAAAAQMRRLHHVIESYQTETLKLAEENIKLMQKGYNDGLVSLTLFIQAQQQITALRQSYLEILGAYTKARTQWEVAAGVVLPPSSKSSKK